jgi:hypothetical protein
LIAARRVCPDMDGYYPASGMRCIKALSTDEAEVLYGSWRPPRPVKPSQQAKRKADKPFWQTEAKRLAEEWFPDYRFGWGNVAMALDSFVHVLALRTSDAKKRIGTTNAPRTEIAHYAMWVDRCKEIERLLIRE